MAYHYFTDNQIIPLIISSIILFCSILFFNIGKIKTSLIFLFFGSLALGFFMANLDHFLIIWDEQYHALVAKNMMTNPFKPTLYETPLIDYDYKNWVANHIWVHKQPLFLWQMALSLKFFGISELSIRLPSILMHAVAAIMIYRIGKISNSSNIGYYGALFFTVAYFPLEMVAGKFATDHNDLIFLCYVTASFWAWFEYSDSKKIYWLIFIGVFTGCSVLVKWLPGLLVFATWWISMGVEDKKNWLTLKSYFPILISGFIALVVFIPWQLYIFYRFPLEAKNEYLHNVRHFVEPLEGHGGSIWFHFNAFNDIYGTGFLVPFIYLGGLYLLIKKSKKINFKVTIISSIIITYLFFSLAETKMIAFCLIVSPFFFLGLAALIDSLIQFIKSRFQNLIAEKIYSQFILVVVCMFLINLSKIENYHTDWKPHDNCNRKADLEAMDLINKLKKQLGNDDYVVFNAKSRLAVHIPIMFYTDYVAYDVIPTEEQIKDIESKKYKIAVIESDTLPNYIKLNNEIVKIKL